MSKIYIFGEVHWKFDEINKIIECIRKIKPDVVVLEHFYSETICNRKEALEELKTGKKNLLDEGFSKHYVKLAAELNVPFIGADFDFVRNPEYDYIKLSGYTGTKEQYKKLSMKHKFYFREKVMLARMREVIESGKYNKIVGIFGDTHLRTIVTPELGPSSPITRFYKGKATIIRSNYPEIE